MTPRKLSALAAVHIEVKSGKSTPDIPADIPPTTATDGPWKGAKFGYVDQI